MVQMVCNHLILRFNLSYSMLRASTQCTSNSFVDLLMCTQNAVKELEVALSRQEEQKKLMDTQYRQLISDKTKLEGQVSQLADTQRRTSTVDQSKMEADLTRCVMSES